MVKGKIQGKVRVKFLLISNNHPGILLPFGVKLLNTSLNQLFLYKDELLIKR